MDWYSCEPGRTVLWVVGIILFLIFVLVIYWLVRKNETEVDFETQMGIYEARLNKRPATKGDIKKLEERLKQNDDLFKT